MNCDVDTGSSQVLTAFVLTEVTLFPPDGDQFKVWFSNACLVDWVQRNEQETPYTEATDIHARLFGAHYQSIIPLLKQNSDLSPEAVEEIQAECMDFHTLLEADFPKYFRTTLHCIN